MFVKNRFVISVDKSMVIKKEKNMQNQNKFVENSQSFAPPPPTSWTEFLPQDGWKGPKLTGCVCFAANADKL